MSQKTYQPSLGTIDKCFASTRTEKNDETIGGGTRCFSYEKHKIQKVAKTSRTTNGRT